MRAMLEARLRKAWHIYRRRQRRHAPKPNRLVVTKAKWLGDAQSPVVLMIDDLTNAWAGKPGERGWVPGGDWGGGLDDPGGALAFLENNLLRDFPEVRATFFVVAGAISAYTHHQPFGQSSPMDATVASRRFFTALARDPRLELAYHGFNHGSPGEVTESFLQEWRGFPSRAAAAEQTRKGIEIFERGSGGRPHGGKYGGWDYNEYAGDAVSDTGFLWWCRDWMPRDTSDKISDDYYEPQFFGDPLVVALPTTVHGYFWDPRQIERLLERGQVISIEEHIAPVRPDGLVQTPNIVDDAQELRKLYAHLRGRNVWHANCTDIAAYVAARELSVVSDATSDGFTLRYQGRFTRSQLTLRIDCAAICDAQNPAITVTAPDGATLGPDALRLDPQGYRHLVTIPVQNGRYSIRCAPARKGDH